MRRNVVFYSIFLSLTGSHCHECICNNNVFAIILFVHSLFCAFQNKKTFASVCHIDTEVKTSYCKNKLENKLRMNKSIRDILITIR